MPRHELTAEFVINTPLFMSGADQEKAELRVASIKGAIRFWWRALNYAKYEGNSAEKLAAMKADEDRLFGSTKGQSQILFSLGKSEIGTTEVNETLAPARNGLGMRYLGYGVMDAFDGQNTHAGKLIRPCINHNSNFTLHLLSKKQFEPSIIDAIKLFGLVGGLGSRSRKGYGSVTLLSFKDRNDNTPLCTAPTNYKEYERHLNYLLTHYKIKEYTHQPEITAFSNNTEIYFLTDNNNTTSLLNHYGEMMLRYRSAGRGWQINDNISGVNFPSEKRFKKDHHWHKDEENWRQNHKNFLHPERIVFGLPHDYFSRNGNDIKISKVKPADYDRRASPLFFHIHKMGNKYSGIALIMKSKFLPDNKNGEINADDPNNPVKLNIDNSYSLLSNFLTGYIRHEPNVDSEEHYFPDHKQIYPPKVKEDKA